MSKELNPNQNKYTNRYIQFTATPYEKKQIQEETKIADITPKLSMST